METNHFTNTEDSHSCLILPLGDWPKLFLLLYGFGVLNPSIVISYSSSSRLLTSVCNIKKLIQAAQASQFKHNHVATSQPLAAAQIRTQTYTWT